MPATRKIVSIQNDHDECESLVWRAVEDGRIDAAERDAIRAQFALIRGGLSQVDGALAMAGTILDVCEITPKVGRRLREIERDTANVIAFRQRSGIDPLEAA